MAVAADGDARIRPVAADAPHHAPQMTANLFAARRLARTEQDRDRTGVRRIIDVDRQKAPFVVMGVEQRKLLIAMRHVAGVVDVEGDGGRRAGVAATIEVDHGVGHAHHLAQGGHVLPTRHGRLGAQIIAAVRQATTGHFEPGVGAQEIEVVGIFVAAGDGKHPGPQDIADAVRHQRRVARVRDQARECVRYPEFPLRRAEQHDAAVRGDASAIKGGHHLLAANGRKAERGNICRAKRCGHGMTRGDRVNRSGLTPDIPAKPMRCTDPIPESLLCAE